MEKQERKMEIILATKGTTEKLLVEEPRLKETLGNLVLEFRNKKDGKDGKEKKVLKETLILIGIGVITKQIEQTWATQEGASELTKWQFKATKEAALKLVIEEVREKFEELEEKEGEGIIWSKLISGATLNLEIRTLDELILEDLKETSGKGGGRLSKEIILEYFEEEILESYLGVLLEKGLEEKIIEKQVSLVRICFSKLASPNVGLKEEFLRNLGKINELNKENSNFGVKEKIKAKIEAELFKLEELKKAGKDEIFMI